jgi:hypothetical protein
MSDPLFAAVTLEDLCTHLCWKDRFVPAAPGEATFPSRDGFYWCILTQTVIGPDGQAVDPLRCSSRERPCFGTGHTR